MPLKPEISGELRSMVRDVLRETVANKSVQGLTAVESVRIAGDADLQTFVQRLLDPATQVRVRAGKLKFALAGSPETGALSGVVSEKTIDRHGGRGVVVLAPNAVLTPLARDRARKLGLKIERRR